LGGLTPEEISASVYPELTLAQVYAALAYYEEHRYEVEQAAADEATFVEQFLKDHPQLVCDTRPAGR
jgi:Fe2+ or Zn2+ uptake regulation protein